MVPKKRLNQNRKLHLGFQFKPRKPVGFFIVIVPLRAFALWCIRIVARHALVKLSLLAKFWFFIPLGNFHWHFLSFVSYLHPIEPIKFSIIIFCGLNHYWKIAIRSSNIGSNLFCYFLLPDVDLYVTNEIYNIIIHAVTPWWSYGECLAPMMPWPRSNWAGTFQEISV